MTTAAEPLLEVRDLHLDLSSRTGTAHVLEGVYVSVAPGESLGIIGESGSGKSVLARALIGVQPPGVTTATAGRIRFARHDVLGRSPRQRRGTAAARMAMIFQDPSSTLNPTVRVGRQVLEGLDDRPRAPRRSRRARLRELLDAVGLTDVERISRSYPSQLSGGQRQRIGIAAALAGNPLLLIADEPTTALDVTMQRTVLDLVDRLRATQGMSLIHITHDLGVLTDRTDRIAVMYAGRIVESGPTARILTAPAHPYTRALLDLSPRLSSPAALPLPTLPGSLPDLSAPRRGCPFAARCAHVQDVCRSDRPPLTPAPASTIDHTLACWHPLGPTRDPARTSRQAAELLTGAG